MTYKQNFKVSWSEDNQEYVGLCSKFPQLSCYDKSPVAALRGIRNLVEKAMNGQPNLKDKTI